jgi:hypothetical protein
MIFGFSLAESRKAVVAALYLVFSIVMLAGVVPHVGFEEAVIAVVGPAYAVIGVFMAKNHSVDDLQKALEALKAAITTTLGFYIAVPASTANILEMLITGIVMAVGVWWTKNAASGKTSVAPANGPPA